jgi:capsular exopolysaccharide synthesis family protein
MDITYYVKLVRRWIWLLLAASVIGAAVGLALTLWFGPFYKATTLLSVGGFFQSPDPAVDEVRTGVDLAQTYMVMATTRDVLQAALDETGFPLTVEELRRRKIVEAEVPRDTSIVQVNVTYSNPILAASLANQIAQQLILVSPTDPRLSQSGRRDVPSNYLQVVEWASVPNKPAGLGPVGFTILGGVLGVVLVGIVINVFDYLDHSIRVAEEVNEKAVGSVLVTIPRHKWPSKADCRRLVMFHHSSPAVHRFRALRTLLLRDSEAQQRLLYVITSPCPHEGKSFVISNLAIAFAAANKRVLLVDADLRRPGLHRAFGRENEKGLTDLLNTKPPGRANNRLSKASAELAKFCQGTEYEGLSILTSGAETPTPMELLASEGAAEWFSILHSLPGYDVILVDSPPGLVTVDTCVIACATGGSVIMVVRSGKTEEVTTRKLSMSLQRHSLKVRGVVLTDVPDQEFGGRYIKSLEFRQEPQVSFGAGRRI